MVVHGQAGNKEQVGEHRADLIKEWGYNIISVHVHCCDATDDDVEYVGKHGIGVSQCTGWVLATLCVWLVCGVSRLWGCLVGNFSTKRLALY